MSGPELTLANSDVVVFPRYGIRVELDECKVWMDKPNMRAPAFRKMETADASVLGRFPWYNGEPNCVGMSDRISSVIGKLDID